MSDFIPLRIISGFSFLRSGLTINKILASIKKNGLKGAALADFSFLYGIPHFVEAMEKEKLPYLVGASFNFGDEYVAYVLKEEGYLNLVSISTSFVEGNLTLEYFASHLKGLAIVLETNHGDFFDKIKNDDTHYLKQLADLSSKCDLFYLGIETTSKEEIEKANEIRKFAESHSYNCIAFPRIQYQSKDDAIILTMVKAIENEEKIVDKKETGNSYFMNPEAYSKIYTKKEIEATSYLLNQSKFVFVKKRGELLHYPVEDANKALRERCFSKLEALQLNSEVYKERLNHELSVISELGYAHYFLIVEDYVNYAKNHEILVGPGRGSSAGSLVAYLLNITEVDPIVFNTSFERFLNKARKTMPDIDVDFMDIYRDDMVQYMRDKYGKDRVSNIITFQTIQAKQSLRDVGRIYDYPTRHIDMLCKSITEDLSLREAYKKLEAFRKIVDSDSYFLEIVSLASKLENLPRQSGVHPAGVILNNSSIRDVLPLSLDLNDNYISQYESDYLEAQGFLKMDFLSIRTLTTIDCCIKLVNKNLNKNLSFYEIPHDDKNAIGLLNQGMTAGIFQLESDIMKQAIKIIKPTSFDDIVALVALVRPGPMDNIKDFALRKEGKKKVIYINEDIKNILSYTYGILVYQEQISALAEIMAGYSKEDADLFRRAVSHKEKDILESSKQSFISGSIKNGYSKEDALKTFADIIKFANYGFNKSHAVVYAITASRMAYLKHYYPLEFYVALLTTASGANDSKFASYLSELRKRGLNIFNPDINESTLAFELKENGLLFPLNFIKGISNLFAEKIIDERNLNGKFNDFFSFAQRMYKQGLNESLLLKLIDAGAFDKMNSSRASLRATVKYALQFAELSFGKDGQLILDDALENQKQYFVAKDDPIENLNLEYQVLGSMISGNPLRYKKDILKRINAVSLKEAKESTNEVTIAGIITAVKIIKTRKKGESMAFIHLIDENGEIEVTIFPRLFASSIAKLERNNIVYAVGHYEKQSEEKESFIANQIENLED